MNLSGKRGAPESGDALAPAARMVLSVVVTGFFAFALEYTGAHVLRAYSYSSPLIFYGVIAIFALGLGAILALLRHSSVVMLMLAVGGVVFFGAL
ncbi:MAG: hypothetical protein AAB354_08840 [candidate division KSB1 bacterium]